MYTCNYKQSLNSLMYEMEAKSAWEEKFPKDKGWEKTPDFEYDDDCWDY